MNAAQNLQDIARSATKCPTCPSDPNPENFGGMCDPCDTAARERRARQGALLASIRKAQGLEESYEDRVIIAAGKRAAATIARKG